MISIVGYIKVDESKPERVDYFIASLKSLEFLKPQFIISLQTPSEELLNKVINALEKTNNSIIEYKTEGDYGMRYSELLKSARYQYVMNFIEDHFCVCDDIKYINSCLDKMEEYKVDICKATFNKIELNSISTIKPIYSDDSFFVFDNNHSNHIEYQKYYGSRYYIGVNFITTKQFAKRFWSRHLGKRPHEYEIAAYDESWRHECIVPKKEILCAIDDSHGEIGTELISRENKKFKKIYDSVIQCSQIQN